MKGEVGGGAEEDRNGQMREEMKRRSILGMDIPSCPKTELEK